MAKPAAYLFDLDGTLVDSAPDLTTAVNYVATTFGCQPVIVDKVRQWVGQGARRLLTEVFTAAGHELPDTALAMLLQYYEQHIADASLPYPGVMEALTALHQAGYALAVVTNKYKYLASPLLSKLNLASMFTTVVGGTCAGKAKPHPEPVLLACSQLGVAPAQALMVGDSYYDEEAAFAAGASYRQVTYGYADHNKRPDGPEPATIDSLLELV